MSFEATRAFLAAHVETNWSQALLPTEWQGHERGTVTTWGRWSILDGATMPAAIGALMTRSIGILALQVFTPENAGTKLACQCADALAALFDYKQFSTTWGSPARPLNLRFNTVSKTDVGIRNGQQQFNLTIQFTRDSFLA